MSRRVLSKSRSVVESSSQSPILRGLLLHLASERGLANNSIHGYRRDLEDLERFLIERGRSLGSSDPNDYIMYLRDQSRKGQATRTVARRLAAIRTLLRYRMAEGEDLEAVLEQLERPKPERSLPKILSRAQVNQLISAPDPESPLFFRDVAILEMLYAAGLRASELCDLKLNDLNLQVECVRVLGKGMKERVVPVGQAAREALERYLMECRPKLDRRGSDRLFLSRTGKPLERIALWMLVVVLGVQQLEGHVLQPLLMGSAVN